MYVMKLNFGWSELVLQGVESIGLVQLFSLAKCDWAPKKFTIS